MDVELTHVHDGQAYSVYGAGKVYRDYPADRLICELDYVEVYLLTPSGGEVRLHPIAYRSISSEIEDAVAEALYASSEMERRNG